MKTVKIGNVEVGKGRPKVIVPIVAETAEETAAKGRALAGGPMDVVEWRADFYEDVFSRPKLLDTAKQLRRALGDTPVLFTFRTKKEGGEQEADPETYAALCRTVAESGYVDAVDVELFTGGGVLQETVTSVHRAGAVVVGSSHDFHRTPDREELVRRMRKMQELDMDLPKIAVMPQTLSDVIVLEDATREMAERYADRPIITMSMGRLGIITRIAGETFGSSMTFGAVGRASAPGQIPAEDLVTALEILHRAL